MTERQRLHGGLGQAAWGYFFLLFNFEINGLNLLPHFVGYILLLLALKKLGEEQGPQRDLALLRPLCLFLVIYHLVAWFGLLQPLSFALFLSLLAMAATVYFHFQFLTNMAELAEEVQPPGSGLAERIKRWRSIYVVLHTAAFVVLQFWDWQEGWLVWLLAAMIIVWIVAGFMIMLTMFDLRKLFREEPPWPA